MAPVWQGILVGAPAAQLIGWVIVQVIDTVAAAPDKESCIPEIEETLIAAPVGVIVSTKFLLFPGCKVWPDKISTFILDGCGGSVI